MAEGLLEIDPNRGAVIRELTDEEIVEILELQLLVEKVSLASAVPRMTAEALGRARELHESMLGSNDPVEWALLNRDFHLSLSSPSGRSRTLRMLRELLNVSTIQLRQDIAEWSGRRAHGESDHVALLDAAEAGDVDSVISLIEKHTGAAIAHRLEIMSGATRE